MRLRHKLDDYTEIQSDVLKMAPEVPTIEYEDYFHLRYDIVQLGTQAPKFQMESVCVGMPCALKQTYMGM